MISFQSDYICGAHPKILQRLMETNMEPMAGYGDDSYTKSAKEKIQKACGADVTVEFLTGGTQTNMIVIATMLKDYEGVVAAATGHINAHEAGAVEYTGNKVLPLPQQNGKINASDLKALLADFYADDNHEHPHLLRPRAGPWVGGSQRRRCSRSCLRCRWQRASRSASRKCRGPTDRHCRFGW